MTVQPIQPDAVTILAGAMDGDPRLLARAISLVEAGVPAMREALASHRPRRWEGPGAPHVVGLSGPPGAGKSSLVDRMIDLARARGQRVAVLAVDPSSPFSGGSILGDRVRMVRHSGDPGVFVRSCSSRGHLGGLSMATGHLVDLLDLCGWDLVLVETVGVGQSEIAIMEVADTVVVVLTPESGDTVQTMKAGLLEIADLFVVNKADRPGAPALLRDLELAVALDDRPGWKAPVLQTSALLGQGIDEVLLAVIDHLEWCRIEGQSWWCQRRASGRLHLCLDMVTDLARKQALRRLEGDMADLGRALARGEVTPFGVFRTLTGTAS